jgi:hypothetical protein
MLVQICARMGHPSLPVMARGMRPASVFTNELQERHPQDVVRVRLDLSGSPRVPHWLVDGEPSAPPSYVLCLDGISAWSARRVPVVSDALAVELQKLLEPWWDTDHLVVENVLQRGVGVSPCATATATASRAAAASLQAKR